MTLSFMEDYGDFTEVKEGSPVANNEQQETPARVRLPRQREFIGVVMQRYGGNRMEVLASDGKTRNCRVPGRFKRSLWLRPKDIVIVQPWPDDDNKADIIFKYNSSAVIQLKKRGMLENLKNEF
jgi:translation initiation factor 1A